MVQLLTGRRTQDRFLSGGLRWGMSRQGRAWLGKAGCGAAREPTAHLETTTTGSAWQGMSGHGAPRRGWAWRGSAWQGRAREPKAHLHHSSITHTMPLPPSPPRDRTRTEHIGTVEKIIFTSPSKDWCKLATTENHIIVGPADGTTFPRGTTWRWFGRWEDHPQFGPQFKFATYVQHLLHGKTGTLTYLTRTCEGVGEKTATRLWERYQGDAVRMLREEPEKVATECKVSAEICKAAAKELADAVRTESTRIELFQLFTGRGFPGALIEKVIEKHDVRAPALIRKNPFVLLGLPGAGFKRCDKLWNDLGLPKDSPKRSVFAAVHLLTENSAGHTWLSAESLAALLRGAAPGCDPVHAFRVGIRARKLKKHRELTTPLGILGGAAAATECVYLSTYQRATAEERIAANVRRLTREVSEWPTDRVPVSKIEGDKLPSQHQVDRLRLATRWPVGLFLGGPGTGKAMPLDTPVLTPTGYRPMGAIAVGDRVIGADGQPTEVLGVFPQGEVDIYRVHFSDGASVECCGQHLWFTATRQERKNARRRGMSPFDLGRVRSTTDIANSMLSTDGHFSHFIPLVQPVEFAPGEPLPIDPYAFGCLLGNGHLGTNCVQLSTPDASLAADVEQRLPTGTVVTPRLEKKTCPTYLIAGSARNGPLGRSNPVLNAMQDLGLAGLNSPEKFIPSIYKLASPEARLHLIQGLLDTDGYTDGHNVEYSTSSPRLAADFVFVVESLGGTCTTTWRDPVYTHKGERRVGKRSARILVKLPPDLIPFRLARKRNRYRLRTKYLPVRQIVKVEPIGKKSAQCIRVAAADSLYVADRFIVTHNTHTLSFLLREVIGEFGEDAVAVAAPTGKAAVRATQALNLTGLNLRATTIHRLLQIGRNGHDGEGWGFQRNRGNPLDCKFLVLDESSMIDAGLMADVLDAIPSGGHILFVGDPYQLPPVGHGAPLRDLIDAGIPHGELTEVRRNAGQIVHACVRIKNGESFDACKDASEVSLNVVPPTPPRNLLLIDAKDEAKQVEALTSTLNGLRQQFGFDPVWSTQVIVARNTRGEISRVKLNERLHPMLNQDGHGVAGNPFKVGDKIICLRNSYMHRVEPIYGFVTGDELDSLPRGELDATANAVAWDASNYDTVRDDQGEPEEAYVANGEIGKVVAVKAGLTVARFSEADELVKIPMGKKKEGDDDGEDGGAGGGGEKEKGQGCNFDHAYAITVHKAQGSESPCVIVMADAGANQLAERAWYYTAISRASKLCIVIGSKAVIDKQRMRQSLVRRKTFVSQRVRDVLQENI